MNVLNHARLIIYRMHEKGLEVFLTNPGLVDDDEYWNFPDAELSKEEYKKMIEAAIQLDPVKDKDGKLVSAVAIEGDWHDMPSIRKLVKHDVNFVKSKIKDAVPEVEEGGFFAIKEAFKKVLPQEYQFLKELKDVILEQNQVKYI
jgi:predicted NUDIX family NTP pyrophosphohydrolase